MGLLGPPDVEKMEARKDVKGLIKALGYRKCWLVRKEAAEALGKIDDPQVVEPFINALKDWNYEVREIAAEALVKIGDPRAVEPLIAALKDKDWKVRQAAAEALVKMYLEGALDEQAKKCILAAHKKITMRHGDDVHCYWTGTTNHGDHYDKGIGVEFPI